MSTTGWTAGVLASCPGQADSSCKGVGAPGHVAAECEAGFIGNENATHLELGLPWDGPMGVTTRKLERERDKGDKGKCGNFHWEVESVILA